MTRTCHLVERPPDINGAILNDCVHYFRDGYGEVGVAKLGVEENFRTQEALVSNVNAEWLKKEKNKINNESVRPQYQVVTLSISF